MAYLAKRCCLDKSNVLRCHYSTLQNKPGGHHKGCIKNSHDCHVDTARSPQDIGGPRPDHCIMRRHCLRSQGACLGSKIGETRAFSCSAGLQGNSICFYTLRLPLGLSSHALTSRGLRRARHSTPSLIGGQLSRYLCLSLAAAVLGWAKAKIQVLGIYLWTYILCDSHCASVIYCNIFCCMICCSLGSQKG